MYQVEIKRFSDAPVNYAEVVRYSGAKSGDEKLKEVIDECILECKKENALSFAVCYTLLPLKVVEDECDFTAFTLKSKNLATAMRGASSSILFACTVGMGIDRLIKKYSIINPTRALVLQALGAERVESFIDVFIEDYEKSHGVKLSPRFSPGYGDLSLSTQKEVFGILNPEKHLGLTLNDSLLMSPSKSVTAFAGINGECKDTKNCTNCNNSDCSFRR